MDNKLIDEKLFFLSRLNELDARIYLGLWALELGRGGITKVHKFTGKAMNTIRRGILEIEQDSYKKLKEEGRIRQKGGGRKKIIDTNPTLKEDLEKLIEPFTLGDPMSPLKWTTKSLRNLCSELNNKNHKISYRTISEILHSMKYSLQSNSKSNEGTNHPDRNKQFEYINEMVKSRLNDGEPVISVDAKKKEIVGNFKNGGREWRPKASPEEVQVHDFLNKELGKVCPYGVYDLAKNEGWVSVGIDHDTAQFAVESIRQWWKSMGKEKYPNVKSLLITADAGGSNGYRSRLWKRELQKLANRIKIPISVCHFPPGTSKWNKIEHKLFSFISKNWRAKPLISHEVIINLIGSTTTKTGLKVRCRLDERKYHIGIKVSNKEMKKINMIKDKFHGEWNYTISPNKNQF